MTVVIPGAKRETSRVGFGCAFLVGGVSKRSSTRLIEVALEAGIRHFDVAPNYGLGLAENVLGDVLKNVHPDITITTKAGIDRPFGGVALSLFRASAGVVLKRVKATKRISATMGARLATKHINISPQALRASLFESLRRLKRDRADIFLLHEMRPNDVPAAILDELKDLKNNGIIGSFGIGTGRSAADEYLQSKVGDVVQVSFDAFHPVKETNKFLIYHRVFLENHLRVLTSVRADRVNAVQLCKELDYDICDPEQTGELLLASALSANKSGIVLVSTRKIERVKRLAKIANEPKLLAAGSLFGTYLARMHSASKGRV